MDLADIRQAIDGIDTTLLNSFVERMDIATEVAKSKIEMDKAVFDDPNAGKDVDEVKVQMS